MNTVERASLGARLGAFGIDFIITCIIQAFLFLPFIMIPLIQKNISGSDITTRNLWITMFSFTYMIFRDVSHGRSLGKRALHLQVRRISAEPAPLASLILRNLFIIIYPVEAIWLLVTSGEKRLGDIVANTGVYKDKKQESVA